MRNFCLIALLVLFCGSAFAQGINYQKTFEQTLLKADKTNKPIFIYIPPPSFTNGFTFKSGLDLPEVTDQYNKSFISYLLNIRDTSLRKVAARYQIGNLYPCYLFLDSKGNLVYRGESNSIYAEKYLTMATEAIARINSGKTIVSYEKRYNAGKVDANFLKEYITLREELGLYDNAKLIDEYVGMLTIKSFDDYQTVLFVLKAGPYAYGKAYNLAYINKKVADSVYKTEPLQLRVAINSRITNNTRAEAIRTKNIALARNVSTFSASTWQKDYRRGSREAQNEMLIYYKAVNDTARYYQEAQFFYDNNYMKMSADSSKKLMNATLENIRKNVLAKNVDIANTDTSKFRVVARSTLSVSGSNADPVSQALNNGAYTFYQLGTHNPAYLLKALLWSRRSIELTNDNYNFYDTYAHLLYRFNLFEDAEANQAKAINLAKNKNAPAGEINQLQGELTKMKQHKL